MVGGHYPMLSAHSEAWLIVAFVLVGGACLRHALIRHETGAPFAGYAWTLPRHPGRPRRGGVDDLAAAAGDG